MKITWCGHSCFLVETREGSAVLDPYAPGSVPGLSLPALTADLRGRAPEREKARVHRENDPQLP